VRHYVYGTDRLSVHTVHTDGRTSVYVRACVTCHGGDILRPAYCSKIATCSVCYTRQIAAVTPCLIVSATFCFMRFNFDHCGIMQTDCFCALQLYGNWIFANKVSAFSARVAEKTRGSMEFCRLRPKAGLRFLGEREVYLPSTHNRQKITIKIVQWQAPRNLARQCWEGSLNNCLCTLRSSDSLFCYIIKGKQL